MRRSLLYFALLSCVAAFVNGRNHNRRTQELTFVHTFDTRESCMARCRTTCTQHHSEDLMMARWQCPQQSESPILRPLIETPGEDLKTSIIHCQMCCCDFDPKQFQDDDGSSVDDDEDNSIAGNLVLIVPAAIVGSLLFLFCCISCLQRFCRNDDL